MPEQSVVVNRAPVLTLWAAIVAERVGHDHESALSLGRAVAGLNAQSKGQALGIFHAPERGQFQQAERPVPPGERQLVPLLGRMVTVKETPAGVRAVSGGDEVDPEGVQGYLERSFGESLPEVRAAMEELARSYSPEALDAVAYGLYEKFRPQIAAGKRGWGQKGVLDLATVRALARH